MEMAGSGMRATSTRRACGSSRATTKCRRARRVRR
jgi:hypothetical protein